MTKIEYADDVVNDQGGCQKVGPGCDNCYAISFGPRLSGMGIKMYDGVVKDGNWTGRINFNPGARDKVLRRKKPTTYFWNTMSDTFHEHVPGPFIDSKIDVMGKTPQHQHLLFTKRYCRTANYLFGASLRSRHAHPNVIIVFSVSVQKDLDKAGPSLQKIAALGWRVGLSLEPLLGEIDLSNVITVLDRVYCGGESGPGARPMHPDWARSVRDQCATANVPFHFKQWGEWCPDEYYGHDLTNNQWMWIYPDGSVCEHSGSEKSGSKLVVRVGKKAAGRLLDRQIHNGGM